MEELRPWMAQPKAGSLAERAGLRAQDDIVAIKSAQEEAWQPLRSMADLQWHITVWL